MLGDSDYHIDCAISEQGKDPWRMTCIYDEAHTHLRYHTWDLMKNICNSSNLPWLSISDFDEVLRPEEHDGVTQRSNAQIQDFREAIETCMMLDIGYKGRSWTFEKKVAGEAYT